MKVLVCGGRGYSDRARMFRSLDALHADEDIKFIIHGASVDRETKRLCGADRWAEEWAIEREVPYLGFPARWTIKGRAAGPIRNGLMLSKAKPDVVAYVSGGRGTANMVKQAAEAHVRTINLEDIA